MQKRQFLNVSTQFNIGELNDKKINAIIGAFDKNWFAAPYSFISQNGLSFSDAEGTTQINISSNQIMISINRLSIDEDSIESIQKYLSSIIDVLMLDDVTKAASLQYGYVTPLNKNTMELTKNLIPNTFKDVFNDSLGLGFRFLFNGKNGLVNEFKLEPYISDNNCLYGEGIYNYANLNCKYIKEQINYDIKDFNSRIHNIINNIK